LALQARHLNDLRCSGLTDQTIRTAKVWSASPEEASTIFGRRLECGALGFPYPGTDLIRLKPDTPCQLPGWKKPAKYLTPAGAQNRLYIPFPDRKALQDPTILLIITEGEKKALAGCQAGYLTIGLSGVWNWCRGNLRKQVSARSLTTLIGLPWTGVKSASFLMTT
jgi:hypothetical protein